MATNLEYNFEASIVEGYPMELQPLMNTAKALRETPQYKVNFPQFLANFKLAAQLRSLELGSLAPQDLDPLIKELTQRLMELHPTLPLLTQEAPMENPMEHLPVAFKLRSPTLKVLNTLYDLSGADALMREIQDFVELYFQSEEGMLPVLSLVHRDAKGGKGLLNFQSSSLKGLNRAAAIEAFLSKVDAFQLPLEALIRRFDATHGSKLPKGVKVHMLFGGPEGWELAEDAQVLTTEDQVLDFILAEGIANLARLPQGEDRRGVNAARQERRHNGAFLPARSFMGILELELRKVFPDFRVLIQEHVNVPEWRDSGIFTTLTDGTPFLSLAALQSLRKGTFSVHYPFVEPEQVVFIEKALEVVNTIDVLKPFVAGDAPLFYERLESLAALLTARPQTEDGKKEQVLRLATELRVSLKDREVGGEPIAQTRFAVSEQLYTVLCTPGPHLSHTLAVGDVAGFGAANLFVLYKDLLTFYQKFPGEDPFDIIEGRVRTGTREEIDKALPQLVSALKQLLLSAGDEVTEIKKMFDARLKSLLSGIVINSDRGDEIEAVYPTEASKEGMAEFLRPREIRMALVQLPHQHPMDMEAAADLVALSYVFGEGLMEVLKVAEKVNDEISDIPVNVTVSH